MEHCRIKLSGLVFSVGLSALVVAGCSGSESRPGEAELESSQAQAIDDFVHDAAARYEVPGAAVAVIRDGAVVYEAGFGVRGVEDPRPVTPHTRFMVGSLAKGMTTLMMASLADEGRLDWDALATDVLPDFALSDSEATSQIRVQDLVNHSSGVPRYDTPLALEYLPPTALISSIRTIPTVAAPGEVWNYSNQMFSAGAFAAAHLAGAPYEDEALRDTYRELMQERVFDAIGMPSATLDFDEAIASENHAWPNGYDPETDTLKATPVDYERSVMSVAPGGGIWSDISDLARFGVAQLTGATPEGRRVVSQENLAETHRPGVSVADGTRYAMGWFVSEDYPPGDSSGLGQPAVWHSGDTAGFSSHMVLLPEQQLGVVVLSNRFDSGPFCKAVTRFVLETLLGREPTSDADLFAEETDLRSGMRYVFELSTPVDRDTAEPYLGSFEHHARVVFSDQGFALEGEFGPIPLRSLGDPGLFVSSGLLSGAFVAAFDADNETPLLFASPGDDGLEQVLPLARMTANHAQ